MDLEREYIKALRDIGLSVKEIGELTDYLVFALESGVNTLNLERFVQSVIPDDREKFLTIMQRSLDKLHISRRTVH